MNAVKPGDWVKTTKALHDPALDQLNWRISTDRYTSRDYQEREKELVWMKVWQVVGRADELPKGGDWKVYNI